MLEAVSTEKRIHSEAAVADLSQMPSGLNALFKIAEIINAYRDLDTLQLRLLELIGELIPADAGAILIIPRIEENPTSTTTWYRNPDARQEMRIRREIVIRALCERAAAVADFPSLSGSDESVLCVPLIALQRALGAIYLEVGGVKRFPEGNVHLLTSVAGVAAVTLENVLTLESLRVENQRLRKELSPPEFIMIGESRPIRNLMQLIQKVAQCGSTVLIHGESGTGKELVALAIHRNSPRHQKPFVAINCAAIPDALLESELFGYEKGAFTGAMLSKHGKLELAKDGTVFLDEVGELTPTLQAKLLRALQAREFERLGGTQTIKFGARVIAATNKNPELAVNKGELRRDLFYRLNVVSIPVPPLCEHSEDIPLLASFFATKYAQRYRNRQFKGISTDAQSILMTYKWPGNVRELENAIERAVVMGSTDLIMPDDLPGALLERQGSGGSQGRYYDAIHRLKRGLVVNAIAEANGSYPDAARILGIHPNYLHRLARSFDLCLENRQAS